MDNYYNLIDNEDALYVDTNVILIQNVNDEVMLSLILYEVVSDA